MFGLAKFSHALCIFQPKIFFLTSQKRFRYDFPLTDDSYKIFPKHASLFTEQHANALRVSFEPANKYEVIPDVRVTVPEKYHLPEVNHKVLTAKKFNVENLELEDDRVRTFVDKLHDVTKNFGFDIGTSESMTDTLVNDLLLHVVNFDDWPFKVNHEKIFCLWCTSILLNLLILNSRIKPFNKLITYNESVSAEPEFVINKKKIALIGVEDKHLKEIYPMSGFGEWQRCLPADMRI